jgi:hypothetical protein
VLANELPPRIGYFERSILCLMRTTIDGLLSLAPHPASEPSLLRDWLVVVCTSSWPLDGQIA